MIASARAVAMTTAAIVACAYATPSMAFDIGARPAAVLVVPAAALINSGASASNAPDGQAKKTVTIADLNPPAPIAAPPVLSPPPPPPTLRALVDAQLADMAPDAERECVATAVYFEARGEPVEGQLAVAQVVLNRTASGKYPASACAVVKQSSQFSFVRRGKVPPIARATEAWRKAVAIAKIAWERLARQIGADVLWYHASYVSPGWGRRLTRVAQIGAHVFYN